MSQTKPLIFLRSIICLLHKNKNKNDIPNPEHLHSFAFHRPSLRHCLYCVCIAYKRAAHTAKHKNAVDFLITHNKTIPTLLGNGR